MDTDIINQSYDLAVLSERDMFLLSETLNTIEPGRGQELVMNSIAGFTMFEIGIFAVLFTIGVIAISQIFRKKHFGKFERIKL